MTSTGARWSALAAATPPKPPPTMTTRGSCSGMSLPFTLVPEGELHFGAIALDLAVLDDHVELPTLGDPQVANALRRLSDGRRSGLFPRLRAGAHQLDELVYAVCHELLRLVPSADGPFLMFPKPLSQHPLEDLARPALGQLAFRELHPAGNLVVGQRLPAVRQQLIHAEGVSRLQHHARHDQLAPFGIRDTEHRHLAHCGVLVDHGFDFAGVDVLAAGHDHVLQSIEDVEVPVAILIAA